VCAGTPVSACVAELSVISFEEGYL